MKIKSNILCLCFLLPLIAFSQPAKLAKNISAMADSGYRRYYTLYTYLHGHPELSLQEKYTSAKMAEELRKAGFEVTENIGGYGLVGVLKNGKGPTILIRADMDALPIEEKTGLPYASKVKATGLNGQPIAVMHACGHDMHMTVFIGTANILSALKDKWHGTIIMLAQPAEERICGAQAMIDDGLFRRIPKPDCCIALHVEAGMESGKLGIRSGATAASDDHVEMTVFGIGGHGAHPDKCIDPIVISAQIVMALQTISSREVNPLEPVVVTVGAINGGTKHNIIPDEVRMLITVRAYSDSVRKLTIESIKRISRGIAASAGMPEDKYPLVTISENTASLINDERLTNTVQKTFTEVFGKENVIRTEPFMGSEDFSCYGRTEDKIPILMFWLGSVSKTTLESYYKNRTPVPGLHSPFYAPEPEKTIKTGINAMTLAALSLLMQ